MHKALFFSFTGLDEHQSGDGVMDRGLCYIRDKVCMAVPNWKARLTMVDMNNILPGLFLGSLEAACDLESLQKNKISHVLVVGSGLDKPFPEEIEYHHIEVYDFAAADLISHFEVTSQFIENALLSGGGVLVHCAMGISRSSTIIIAYLMKKQKMTYLDALNFTKKKRTHISPNFGFRKQLQLFEKLNCLIDESNLSEVQQLLDKLDAGLIL